MIRATAPILKAVIIIFSVLAIVIVCGICQEVCELTQEACFESRELDLLARFVEAETSRQPLVCKVAVASVVLNRVDSPFFPPSIAGVIYQEAAFRSVVEGKLPMSADRISRLAACMAVSGIDPSAGALKYWNPSKTLTGVLWQRKVTSFLGGFFFGE